MAEAMQQYTAQIKQMEATFDQAVLPPLKGLLKVASDFGNSGQENPSAEQEKDFETYQVKFVNALLDIVNQIVEKTDIDQFNAMLKEYSQMAGQPIPQEFSKEDLTDVMAAMVALTALGHFEQTHALTEEELELAVALIFPQEAE